MLRFTHAVAGSLQDADRGELQQALRRAQQQQDRVNRENHRRVNDYNRKVQPHNKGLVDTINQHNRDAERHNRQLAAAVNDQNRQADAYSRSVLSATRAPSSSAVRYTASEQPLADRIKRAVSELTTRGTRTGILHDLAGFETARDSIEIIAEKIAHAVRPEAERRHAVRSAERLARQAERQAG